MIQARELLLYRKKGKTQYTVRREKLKVYGPLEVLKLLLVHSLGGMEPISSQS